MAKPVPQPKKPIYEDISSDQEEHEYRPGRETTRVGRETTRVGRGRGKFMYWIPDQSKADTEGSSSIYQELEPQCDSVHIEPSTGEDSKSPAPTVFASLAEIEKYFPSVEQIGTFSIPTEEQSILTEEQCLAYFDEALFDSVPDNNVW